MPTFSFPRAHTLIRPTVHAVGTGSRAAHTSAADGTPEPAAGTPQWLQQAYNLTALSASRGSGDTVAVVDGYDDPGAASDLRPAGMLRGE
jgi:subtilase family serine protease